MTPIFVEVEGLDLCWYGCFSYNGGMEEEMLLQTKLRLPPARAGLVARPNLMAKLDEGLASRLILISAPAGYGKTTLAAGWLAQLDGVGGAWLSLDEQDNDPVRFLTYFIAAGQAAVSGFGQSSRAMMMAPQPPAQEAILTSLVNEIARLERPLIMTLDDYHVINTPAIHEVLSFMLDFAPPQLHLLLTTRADPPLALARLRARGQLTEVRAAGLRFALPETAKFMQQTMGIELAVEDTGRFRAADGGMGSRFADGGARYAIPCRPRKSRGFYPFI